MILAHGSGKVTLSMFGRIDPTVERVGKKVDHDWQSLPLRLTLPPPHILDSAMPTRNISLTTTQDAFIDRMVRTGTYQNASEAVRDALRLLQQRHREDTAKLKALRSAARVGIADLDRGAS